MVGSQFKGRTRQKPEFRLDNPAKSTVRRGYFALSCRTKRSNPNEKNRFEDLILLGAGIRPVVELHSRKVSI
jgi:hypothetical protein